MSGYTPYLIANARTGLELNMDPWLLPEDAFANLDNFYLFQGRIIKRLGCSAFPYGTSAIASPPVMGIFNYFINSGDSSLLMADTKRLYKYSSGNIVDLSGSDTFTGDDTNFFKTANWLNKLYLCNGKDQLFSWDGTTLSAVKIDPGGSGSNTVSGIVDIVPYKDRLVAFNVTESGVRCAQRARWCDVGEPDTWSQANYIDAPTQDVIKGTEFLRDELIVFFDKSIWVFRYLGDPQLPFIWVRISDDYGTVSGKSVVAFQSEIIAASATRMIGCDGTYTYDIDSKIPRLILEMNQGSLTYCHSILDDIDDQIWISYPSVASSKYCDRILVLNYLDGAWSTFHLPIMCFGAFRKEQSAIWSEMVIPWESSSLRWSDQILQAGYPQLIGGLSDGKMVIFRNGLDDSGTVIVAELMTAKMNPYLKSGKKARLGWVDLLVDRQPLTSTIMVDLYCDGNDTPYVSYPLVPLDDGKNADKAWLRIPSGCSGNFHQIRIRHQSVGLLVIHAMVPYFKPSGNIYA